MEILTVGLGSRSYDIWFGAGILPRLGELAAGLAEKSCRAALVADRNVWELYGGAASESLKNAGIEFGSVLVEPGEHSKSLSGLAALYEAFSENGLGRGGLAIALGGGVVGDLCGFAAATYMRGIRYIQVPTTLLAQVDSSVGGKTAINLPHGKNLAGAFHQPSAVLADSSLLSSLPEREIRSGMAEVVKYGAIRSEELFERLRKPLDEGGLQQIIARCCRIKAEIVCRDELDNGERALLNFGHTFGHAAEKLGGFERYTHGEAVALGMVMAASVGERMGVTALGSAERIRLLLQGLGLETACPYTTAELLPPMRSDKKGIGDGVNLVLLKKIGEALTVTVGFEELGELMREAEHEWTQK